MNNDISTVIRLLQSAIGAKESVQRDIVVLAHQHLGEILNPTPKLTLQDMGRIYSEEGYIPAIKKWREVTGQGLKEAKEDIDGGIKVYGWPHPYLGKTFKLICSNDSLHMKTGVVTQITQGNAHCTILMDESRQYEVVLVAWLRHRT